jgi:hypothetical protein
VVGNRILLLSPHPGQVRAELNSHQFDLASAGSAEFQAATQRIHGCCSVGPRTRYPCRACGHAFYGPRVAIDGRMSLSSSADPAGARIHRHAAVLRPAAPALPLARSLWQQGWLRKALILALLAAVGSRRALAGQRLAAADLPANRAGFVEGIASGELPDRSRACHRAAARLCDRRPRCVRLTALAVSTRIGRDLLKR